LNKHVKIQTTIKPTGGLPVGTARLLAISFYSAVALTTSLPAESANYQDWWWNPGQSGMGVNVGQQGDTIAATWYLYGDDNNASFLVLTGTLTGNTVSGNLYRYTGPPPGPGYNPAAVVPNVAGTGSITFTSDTTAVLNYNYDNRSGSLNLQRFSFGTVPLTGTYLGGAVVYSQNCGLANAYQAVYSLTQDGNSLSFTEDSAGAYCVGQGDLTPAGSKYTMQGTFACSDGRGGNLSGSVSADEHTFTASGNINYTQGVNCAAVGVFGGIK
jgi:hypothetical protein